MTANIRERLVHDIQRLMALQLWQLQAIRINVDRPFQLTSGNYSPIYINCRQLISSPAFLDLFTGACRIICEHRDIDFDVVAGGETAGIPFAAYVARAFGKPMVYVRKATKQHGVAARIEGVLGPSDRVILVEDLITDAGSKMSFIEAIRETESTVSDVLVVFDRLQGGRQALAEKDVTLHSLTNIDVALTVAADVGTISAKHLPLVKQYLLSPAKWHSQKGLDFK